MEDNSRYLCAETSEDRKRFVAAVLKNKVCCRTLVISIDVSSLFSLIILLSVLSLSHVTNINCFTHSYLLNYTCVSCPLSHGFFSPVSK